ncbi:LysR family transcriptional regulator [Cohnella abietis]|uniref:LysR family transcriptional regulator n=1 Tax=Cohnella abietis TaxID=2507935 RepID=A0A3T1D2E2_9BACL|nr:LysR family transcriptional regulator [Cohnella abietis]BBI32280.1 LysR family transcriptional regulator [Cohnella abietis]
MNEGGFFVNIENIEAFVYVVYCGSFNKAAEALYLSQPSVTARIQSLERGLDCKLFDRQAKQVQITEEGKRFLPFAQQLLLTYQKGKYQVNQKKSPPEEFRIGCTVSVSNYIFPELIVRLKSKFPNTNYRIVTGITDEIVSKVLNKEVDIGFVRNVTHPSLQSIKFYEDPISLYVYEGHPFLLNERLTVEEIAKEPLVFFQCGALDWFRIHRLFENLDQPPNIQVQTDNSEMAKKLVIQKVGISFLPSVCVQQEVAEGKLFPIHVPETDGITMQTNIVIGHGEHSQYLNTIIETGKELIINRLAPASK